MPPHLGETSAPRLRGCSDDRVDVGVPAVVGPAPAGVLPRRTTAGRSRVRRPRACGGAPPADYGGQVPRASAPRLRGCSSTPQLPLIYRPVGPAPAGVLRPGGGGGGVPGGRPRACGGAPGSIVTISPCTGSAPRLRGCSHRIRRRHRRQGVGPAPAGVLRPDEHHHRHPVGRPRACGGAPTLIRVAVDLLMSAPRLRGCSPGRPRPRPGDHVGPAPAGVLRPRTHLCECRLRRPRACGGAPAIWQHQIGQHLSAPRLRGCSAGRGVAPGLPAVGPAPAGVLPGRSSGRPRPARRPRACGGAPRQRGVGQAMVTSAPRLRGCSGAGQQRHRRMPVGPAPAGVLLAASRPRRGDSSRPRACGGAPLPVP